MDLTYLTEPIFDSVNWLDKNNFAVSSNIYKILNGGGTDLVIITHNKHYEDICLLYFNLTLSKNEPNLI